MNKELSTNKKRAPARRNAPEKQITNALMQSIEAGTLQPEQLQMVLDAQERILDRQAKQEYHADMALCQSEMPEIDRPHVNQQTNSTYAKLEDVNRQIKPVYSRWGFAVSFNSTAASQEGWIGMKAVVSHRGGWTEEHTFELPPDVAGMTGKVNKTVIHGTASSRKYMQRYLLGEIFNLTLVDDEDDDGNAAGAGVVELLTDDEIANIESLLTELGVNEADFLKISKTESIADIPRKRYQAAVHWLEARRDVQQ